MFLLTSLLFILAVLTTESTCKYSHFHNMFLSFLFAKSDLKKCCSDYFEHESNSSVIVFSDIIRGFIAGLASFRVYRETKDIIWMRRGAKRREDLLFWATKGCKWNFDHKLSTLLAEESFSLGDFDTAKGHYTRAIAAADQSRFINDSAIGELFCIMPVLELRS
jgi:hypothetical protein